MPVSKNRLKKQKQKSKRRRVQHDTKPMSRSDMIHNLILQFSKDNPEATEFCINTESEAGDLLVFMAAAMEKMAEVSRQYGQPERARQISLQRGDMIATFKAKKALIYLSENDLELHGLKLVTPL